MSRGISLMVIIWHLMVTASSTRQDLRILWKQSRWCVARIGGHLASIHSQAENNFVSALVDPRNIGGITASIGGTAPGGFCAGPTAAYAWTDGTPWDYENWRLTTG